MKKASSQDEEAFNALFNHFYPKMIQVALAFVQGIDAAQEVVSDVFFKLLKNPQVLERVNDIDNYLFLSVKNQSLTYLKSIRQNHRINSFDNTEDYLLTDLKNPEGSLMSDELFQLVNKTVQKLPPKRKAIYLLIKEEGKKYKEVAEIMGISVKTVELQMSYALRELRKTVKYYLESRDEKIRPIKKNLQISHLF